MPRTISLRNRLNDAQKRLLQMHAREDRLIRAIYEIQTAVEHGEVGITIPWCIDRCKTAIEAYKKAGGIR